ncbi:PH domain-containing protein [Halomonas denitrificans]|nr:PH domain-containing protein [Halomonas denitrificans]
MSDAASPDSASDTPPDDAGGPAWNRLPGSAVAALYINGVQKAVRENLFLFFGAGTGAFLSESFGLREAGLIAGGLLLAGLLVTLVYHRRFRFQVADDAIRVRKGLFEQKELKVRFERVQNVAFSQPLYLKPLGLTRLNLETPGAAQTEVELPGIPTADAHALRDRIAGVRARAADAVETPAASAGDGGAAADLDPAADAKYQPSVGDLFRYGMTSNQIWIVLGVIGGPLAERIGDRVDDAVDWAEQAGVVDVDALSSAPLLAVAAVLGLVALFIALGLVVSGLIAVVRFHGYRLTGDAERLHAEYGLLDRRETSLKRSKLHSLELVQTAFGRVLRRWHAVGHQAALDAMNPINQGKRFLVPGISPERLPAVASEMAAREWRPPEFEPIDKRFRRVYWQRLLPIPLAMAAVNHFFGDGWSWLPEALVAAAVLLAFLIHLRWKRWGVQIGEDGLQVREGLVGTKIILFEDARCQQVKVTTSPYQRRHGLASLTVRLPHGERTVPYLPEALAAELANRMMYRIETSTEHAL